MSAYHRFLFFFFILSCLLANTSLLNVSNVGLPLFWIPLLALILIVKIKVTKINAIFVSLFLLVYLIIVINNSEYASAYFSQFVSRMMLFLIYVVLSCNLFVFNKKYLFVKTFNVLFLLFSLSIFSYMLLVIFDLNTGISSLANNLSFGLRGNQLLEANGWANEIRLSGFWSEPSYMVIPILLFAFLLRTNGYNKKKIILFSSLLILVSFFTFSRSVWSALAIYVVITFLFYNKYIIYFFYKFRFVCLFVCLFGVNFLFITYGLLIGGDSSVSGRVGTSIVSSFMIKDHWMLGFGPNTFNFLKNKSIYLINGIDLSYDDVIHSSLLSLWQQFGIIAIPYIIYPYYCILKRCNLESFKFVFPILITNLISLILYGDFTYFSFYWLLMGVLLVYSMPYNKGDI